MRRALALAERGRSTASPNPLVGCVLVVGGEVVGEGWHERPGRPHAEAAALAAAGERARGAVVYVTLEPCDHTGRTGPCAEALLDAGVARVVAAMADPNPLAAGGAARLRAAGVPVDVGLLAHEAAAQNRGFLHHLATGRPFVVLKTAMSLDGRIAAADGTSRWLTGEAARERAHQLRAEVDAVVVGSGTALADDPRLTVRLPGWSGDPPLRVVLDARRRVPRSARLFDGQVPTLVVTGPDADLVAPGPGVEVVAVPAAPGGGLDLPETLAVLSARQVRSVLVEGGAGVAGAFLRAGLVDELRCHVAPVLLGERGLPLARGDGITTLAGAPRFRLLDLERVGGDALLTLAPAA